MSTRDGIALGTWNRQSSWDRPQYDTTLINATSESIVGYIYKAGYNSTTGLQVTGSGASAIGELVCISGARTGSHCTTEVKSKNGTYYAVDGTAFAGNVTATVPNGGLAGMQGDSGGPVWVSTGAANTEAKGMISKGTNQISCPSSGIAEPGISGSCFSTVIYTSVTGMLSSFNASLL